MESIVTITLNPALDKSANIDRVVPERKLRCHSVRYDPGGGGVNVARALGRLGMGSTAIFFSGGPTGKILEDHLIEDGVAILPIPTESWTRENLTVLEETSMLQYRFGMPGPEVQEAEFQVLLDTVESLDPVPGYLVASGSLPPALPTDAYSRIARIARERGTRLVVDTSGDALREVVAEGVYLLKPNLSELATLEGDRWITDEAHLRDAALRLVKEGRCEVVVVSLGGRGAYVVTDNVEARIPAPAVPIQSKVGAGDTMVAGVVHGLASGKSIVDAARFGVAAGAATVMSPGTELCSKEDVERLYVQTRLQPALDAAGQPLDDA